MCRHGRNFFICNILALLLAAPCLSKPIKQSNSEVETSLEKFLNVYYNSFENKQKTSKVPEEGSYYDVMQGDQPPVENTISQMGPLSNNNFSNDTMSEAEYYAALRNRSRENRLRVVKETILQYLGRNMSLAPIPANISIAPFNVSEIVPTFFDASVISSDDQVSEKIRSFYPSCDVPPNADQELWRDDDVMNLFFTFDHVPDNRNTNIATAILRLYRIPVNNSNANSRLDNCDTPADDEKLLRVSVYRYTKPLKRRRVKRLLSDSKVIPVSAKWVELNVKPATSAWTKGKNAGLGILVEDQEGNRLRADKFFKGATCTVGVSTPKPIPTVIIDAARKSNELDRIFGRNSTTAVHSDIYLLPTIDICIMEFPENYTQLDPFMNWQGSACNLKKIYERNQKIAEKERFERHSSLEGFTIPSLRHIRHQRQHRINKMNEEGLNREFDPRSRIVGSKLIFRNDEVQNITNSNFNFSVINR
ncbi:uncharacterized protein isoform X2 [Leptinotarsa decemlineata]|uniref:uncharacterized protein isoform X2 n=1 Tax=Leptinotarsa decemlineata TaxID=7539 RepID=UPI000C2548B5|nr:uncharacterized protein LOC111509670 isoform X2 [Leptinotarsa decemlineata]